MKRVICLVLSLILITSTSAGVAFDGDEHDKILEKVLFGQEILTKSERKIEFFSSLYGERQSLRVLEFASFLSIDLYNANREKGVSVLRALRDYRIWGLPKNIDKIYYEDAYLHGRYTHLGWNHVYENDLANWRVRKNILLATTEKVFNFRFLPSAIFGYEKQCDSFAALIYYVHVIADFANDEDHGNNLMPFTQTVSELIGHLDILFDSSPRSRSYSNLRTSLDSLKGEAMGSDNTVHYAWEVLKTLKKNLPELLRQKDFFKKVFPSWWTVPYNNEKRDDSF